MNKYINIPFKSHGRDFSGCDCYGLVRLFLKEEFDTVWPDFWDYQSADDVLQIGNLVDINKPILSGVKKDSPDYGDVVLYRFKGYPSHMGIYIGEGRILHIMKNINSCIVPVEHGILRGRVEGYYGVKDTISSS